MDGALDAIAAVDRALADNVSDDEELSAALGRLDAAMSLGIDRNLREKDVAGLDIWFLTRLLSKHYAPRSVPVALLYSVPDDGKWSQDPSDPEQRFSPPLFPIPDGMQVEEYITFNSGPGTGGFFPQDWGGAEFDDLLKVESDAKEKV